MKPRPQSALGSLDSLLDTMTNVVGILVIILVVTILGVQEAVNRISATLEGVEIVSVEVYDDALKQTEQVAAELEQLENKPAPVIDLTDKRGQLAKLNNEIKTLKAKFGDAPEATADPAKLATQLEARSKTLASLNKQTADLRKQAEDLSTQLKATPVPEPPKAKLVTIPNPRSAPKGAEPIYFFCKGGRVYELPLDALMEIAGRRIEAIKRLNRKSDPPCKRLVDFFNSRTVAIRGIRVKVHVSRNRVILRFIPEQGIGETVEQIGKKGSRLRVAALLAAKKGGRYARFLVWPDSYDVYLAARAVTDDVGLAAGWQPNYASYLFQKWTKWTCKPDKPLPPTKPKPKPDPNKPKPPPPLPEPPID